MNKHQTSVLTSLGLSEKEVTLYLAMIGKRDPMRAAEAAQCADLPRTTVYDLLESLQSKGLVEEDSTGAVGTYRVTSPQYLLSHLATKQAELQATESELQQVVLELQKQYLPAKRTMQLFHGKGAALDMMRTQVKETSSKEMVLLAASHFFIKVQQELQELSASISIKVLTPSRNKVSTYLKQGNLEMKSYYAEESPEAVMNVTEDSLGVIDDQGSQLLRSPQLAAVQSTALRALWNSL